jgi:hypothetical protein
LRRICLPVTILLNTTRDSHHDAHNRLVRLSRPDMAGLASFFCLRGHCRRSRGHLVYGQTGNFKRQQKQNRQSDSTPAYNS